MDSVKSFFGQILTGLGGDGHINQEFHNLLGGFVRGRNGFLAAKPCCIFDRFFYVFAFKVRIIFEDVLRGLPCSQKVEDLVYRKSHPSNTRLTVKDIWINGNSFKHNFTSNIRISYSMIKVNIYEKQNEQFDNDTAAGTVAPQEATDDVRMTGP